MIKNGNGMRRFRPIHGLLLIVLATSLILTADFALSGGHSAQYGRVSPDTDGFVRIDVSDLEAQQVRYYRFLNAGNQEVKFFVGRDKDNTVQVAFDASETDYKRKRGFRHEGGWMVNNKCDTASRLAEVNTGTGGCRPVPLEHRLSNNQLILKEADILTGWRFFR